MNFNGRKVIRNIVTKIEKYKRNNLRVRIYVVNVSTWAFGIYG